MITYIRVNFQHIFLLLLYMYFYLVHIALHESTALICFVMIQFSV